MKKLFEILFLVSTLLLFSSCSQKEEGKKKDEVVSLLANPGGYTQDMVNLKKETQQNIQNSANQEKERLEKSLNESQASQAAPAKPYQPDIPTDLAEKYSGAVLKTNYGDIEVKLYAKEAPVAANNFLKLAQAGFYDGTKFHRVIKDFMVQGGDPFSKNDDTSLWGSGGPGYSFADEPNSPKLVRGSLAMANSGPNTNGSQFFILTVASAPWLDGKHTNFGEVVSGMDTVDKIEAIKTDSSDRPEEEAIIEKAAVLEK